MGKSTQRATYITAGLGVLAVVLSAALFRGTAFAQTPFSIEDIGSTIGLGTADLKETILNIIRWVLGILTLVAVGFVIYGGILYVTSRGNEQQIERAKRVIINALIGLGIVLLSWAIVLFVGRFVLGAGGTGTGTACTDGDTRNLGCEVCASGSWVSNPSPPNPSLCLAVDPQFFKLDNVTTSFAIPGDYANNVTLCSNVVMDFNTAVKQATVDTAVSDTTLTILDVDHGSVAYQGTWQTLSDTVTFRHNRLCTGTANPCTTDAECDAGAGQTCDVILFLQNTHYELRIPKTLQNTAGRALALCNALPGCVDAGSYYRWNFATGVENDVTPPVITSTYPVQSGPSYPDTNVDRQPLLRVDFNEAIDPASVMDVSSGTVNDTNIYIERLDGQGGSVVTTISDSDTDGDGKVDADVWNIAFGSNGFRMDLTPPHALEAFTWYRITVQNIEDLCGNGISAPAVWEFQTNDSTAAITSVYPQGENQCPDTKIAATFGTTMYRNLVHFKVTGGASIDITIPAPEVSGLTEVTIGGNTLKILDPVPGGYKQYELTPAGDLPVTSDYTVEVTTDRVIDASGTTLSRTWDFSTATAETCTCAPHVSGISPNQGGPGQCVTVAGYCFTGTAASPATLSTVTIGGTSSGVLGSPTATRIVTTVPASLGIGAHAVQTTIDYGAPFGTLTSNTNVQFMLNTTSPSDGPCLVDLVPDAACVADTVTAKGERFGTTPGTIAFNTLNAPVASWSDTSVRTSVPSGATDGPVMVTDSSGKKSNGMYFDVCTPPEGQVSVVEAKPTCGSACINTVLSARFNREMDTGTFTGTTVRVRKCQSDTCEYNLLDPALGTLVVDPAGYDSMTDTFTFGNSAYFEPNTWYRVLLSGGTSGLASVAGETLTMNFDEDGDGANDAYAWTFKTKDDATACTINSASLLPTTASIGTIGGTRNYIAQAIASPDSCDPRGQVIDVGDIWTWNITTAAPTPEAEFVDDGNTQDTLASVRALSETVVDPPPDYVTVEACASGFCGSGALTIDATWCDETTDCEDADPATPGLECAGSTCDIARNRCTPVIKTLSPDAGPIGTWETVTGCYFDTYDATNSKVLFKDNKQGLCLPTALCGSCASQWSNTEVSIEVPDDSTPDTGDDAVTGPVRVLTKYGLSVDSTDDFTVNGDPIAPGLCRIVPASGTAGVTAVALYGTGFENVQGSGQVTFTAGQTAPITSWSNELVNVVVPSFAQTGLVTVTQNGLTSNGKTFTVNPGVCDPADICTTDADCDAGEGCGIGSCCAARPSVVSTLPADTATGVCRNAGIQITFDRPMDISSLRDTTNYTVSPGSFTVANVTNTSVTLSPGLMVETTTYTVTVSGDILSAAGVAMNADDTFSFTTGTSTCDLDHVVVTPALSTFATTGLSQTLTAQAYAADNTILAEVSGVYEWTWSWTTSKPLTANFSLPPGDNPVQTLVTQSVNGDAVVTATATVISPNTGVKSGTAVIRLMLPGTPPTACGTFAVCTVDSDCSASQGCGTGGCCGWRPDVLSIAPPNGATGICQNAAVLITFTEPMDAATRSNVANYSLTAGGSPIGFTAAAIGSNRALLSPTTSLAPSATHTVVVSNNIKNTSGITMAANRTYSFTTTNSTCNLSSVDVSPSFSSYTDPDVSFPVGAVAYDNIGTPLADLPGVYSYTWSWTNSNDAVAYFTPGNPGDSASGTMMTGTTNGDTTYTARATVDAPNTGSATGTGRVHLALTGSNAVCTAMGADVCTTDTDCSGGQACGTVGCCVDRPQIVSTNPTDGATDVCRNSGITVTFDRDMDAASLRDAANYAVSPGGFTVASVTSRSVYLKPTPFPMDPTTTYTVTVGTGVKSKDGVTMAASTIFDFTTTDSLCNLARVALTPKTWTAYKKSLTKTFQADAIASNNNIIFEAPGVYEWTWGWTTSDVGVANYTAAAPLDNPVQDVITGTTTGRSTLRATATVDAPNTGSASDTAEVQLILCENPWSLGTDGVFIDAPGNCASGSCADFDFTVAYCRGDNPTSLLPDFTVSNIKGDVGTDVKKQYLFKAPSDSDPETQDDDAIGIRIIQNTGLLAPDVWYMQQFPFEAGSPQSTTVDGYPAVRDGRTVYVGATRFDGSNLAGYIYLISYNQDASGETKRIFDAMLKSWRFNAGQGSLPGLGPVDKTAISHDTRRIGDLSKLASALEAYRSDNGKYPDLDAGSFIRGMSTSAWSTSWNATLGNDLRRTLPIDPLNTFSSCPVGFEQASCWDNATKTFQCAAGSHIYLYKTNSGTAYTLYANLEYTGPGSWASGSVGDPCSNGSTCACFNYSRPSP